ncbi:MAG: hypothetical protein KAU48_03440, partial [Candidatus Thorarchaeota archaeon]|nr:hypothetical protein [Candidatus Thorarchaeota archaeon]
MERKNRQYFTYVKLLFILVVILTMVFNPLSGGIASSETTQSPMNSEISQPEFKISEVFVDYTMEEIVDGTWFDVITNGINLGFSGDDAYTLVPFPFVFNYYDLSFSNVSISSNGWMSFTNQYPSQYANPLFPSSDPAHSYCLAPFWDDLMVSNNVYLWNTSEFVAIQYDNVVHYPGSPVAGTFQVVFHSNGTIDFTYLEILDSGDATVGLNYGDGVFYNSYPYGDLLGLNN